MSLPSDPEMDASPAPAAHPGPSTRRRLAAPVQRLFRRTRAWLIPGLLLLIIGAALGHVLLPATATGERDSVAPSFPTVQDEAGAVAEPMPDVIGLSATGAATVLTDAGHRAATVTQAKQPAAGPAGRVIAQEPAAGTAADQVGSIKLTISTPAAMPDLTGRTVAQARAILTGLGAVADVSPVVTAARPPGTVLTTSPAAGQPLPYQVNLRTADGGVSVPLAAVELAKGEACGRPMVTTVNGEPVKNSLACTPSAYASTIGTFVVGRHGVFLEGRIGADDAGATGPAAVRFIGDGRTLREVPIRVGRSTDIRLPISGVLRLTVTIVDFDDKAPARVVLGNARVVGEPAEIRKIRTR
jgi:hypothetical protein